LLTEVAHAQGGQIIAASHSEVVLNEAADRDIVIAFVGEPHRIDDRGSQLLKSLKEIGYDQYYQAEETDRSYIWKVLPTWQSSKPLRKRLSIRRRNT